MCSFIDGNCVRVTYDEVREMLDGGPFTMQLCGADALAVAAAVDQSIDAHLEACFCPERGDSYEWGWCRIGKMGRMGVAKLNCVVSAESMPVLLRRLLDSPIETSQELGQSILDGLKEREHER